MAIGGANVGGSVLKVKMNPPTNLTIKPEDKKLTLKWIDPLDLYAEGQLVAPWIKTVVVMKQGGYPTSPSDGTVIVTNTVRNQYQTNGYTINGLTNGVTYYFSLFGYGKGVKVSDPLQGSAVPVLFKIMTIIINQNNSNPETRCTYADDALTMIPKSSDWDLFFGEKPCLFKDGVVVGYLNPNNFAQFEDGTPADITSGNAGSVMIEYPRMGLKMTNDGTNVTISMTDNPNDPNFSYLAHQRGNVNKDYFYLGAYGGYTIGGKLMSLSGYLPTVNQTIGTFRTQAQANGVGYEQMAFYQLTFIQAMYCLKYKNTNSRTSVGMGYVSGSSVQQSGYNNTNGMTYGTASSTVSMKLFGLENFWGNVYQWIDGIKTDGSYNILTAIDNFNDTGSGYTSYSSGLSSTVSGYLSNAQGTTQTGFIAKQCNGSSSTYYCDYASLGSSGLPYFGGSWAGGSAAGAFVLVVGSSASDTSSRIGARLMYL